MLIIRTLTAVTLVVCGCVAVSHGQEKKIEMTHVKYDGLKQEILKHRGKVVVLDFWATWCPSCMQHFPDFIDIQKKYGDKGLVVISVSLDKTEKDAIDRADRFLTKQNPPFLNLLLDEPPAVCEKQFDFVSLPFYYAFDRNGKWVRFRAADYKEEGLIYKDLDKTIVQMLGEK